MFDGSIETFEVAKRFDSVQWLLIEWDHIILPEEMQPNWEHPKMGLFWGVMEEGEEALEAMKREFLEETGMIGDIHPWITEHKWGGSMLWKQDIYLIKNPQKIQEMKLDAGEKITLKKYIFEEFLEVIMKPDFRNAGFVDYIIKHYLYPWKKEELRKFLFN